MAGPTLSVSATGQRKQTARLRRAFALARTWRWDRLFEAFEFFDDPYQPMAVHEAPCSIMVSFICTCRPVLVLPPARA